ncbi:MAG: cbb3-type cytochrome c oxidase subunit 3 [Rhodobacteraceae bacterium]|nr:cbb3-type cytochrome c oxidase subunit 3 [Paracoccaceae bacterium]
MEIYTLLREFADSWMLLFLFVFFVGMVLWVLTGRSKSYRDTAEMIFRHDDKPLSDEESDR